MEILHGWKPMPVILKIIWILTLVGAVLSILVIFSVYNSGFEIMGFTVYGLWAVNMQFFLELAIPVLILVAMIKRWKWAWILGAGYFLFFAVNAIAGINELDLKLNMALAEMPELPEVPGMDEERMHSLLYWSAVTGLILGAVVDLLCMLAFILKRNYFISAGAPASADPPEGEANS
jgi:hypothetical protein